MRSKRSWVIALAILWVAAVQTDASAQDEYYRYFKEERPLTIVPDQVAIFTPSGGAALSAQSAASWGVSPTDIAPHPVADWTIAKIANPTTRSGDRRVVVAAMADENPASFVSPVFEAEGGGSVIVTPTVLVGFDRSLDGATCEALIAQHVEGVIAESYYGAMPNTYRIASSHGSGFEVLDDANAFAVHESVLFAEPDMILTGSGHLEPSDSRYSESWALENVGQWGGSVSDIDMDAEDAWDITTGSPSIVVVIIDTGVETTHPDINQRTGMDFTSDAGDGGPVNDCDSHGTPVAGCVSGILNNIVGTVGIAPGCLSASARTFISTDDCSGSWTTTASWTVDALAWAETIGARVTNNSNGYNFTSSVIAQKYADTRAAGMVHFASAGNDSSTTITYPSSLPDVNSVAAVHYTGDLASFSNHGPGIAITAPGQTILAADRAGALGYAAIDYALVNGTSFASPFAAGVAALVLSENPSLAPAQVESILFETADDAGDPGYDETFGWGLVNAASALNGVLFDNGYWVDFSHTGTEIGTESLPFNSVAEAADAAPGGATVHVRAGASPDPATIHKNLRLVAEGGPARMGAP